jgi:hypothetical protein
MRLHATAMLLSSVPVRHLRMEADINQATAPAESVENDPRATCAYTEER